MLHPLVIAKETIFCMGLKILCKPASKSLKRLRNKVLNALLCIFKSLGGENMYLVTGAINEQQTRASLGSAWLGLLYSCG